jgi:predicted RND superfamily exporter protein
VEATVDTARQRCHERRCGRSSRHRRGDPGARALARGRSRIESDPINWADPSSASIRNAHTLEDETGFASTLGVFVETSSAPDNGVFTDQMGAFVFDLVLRSLGDNVELAEASSLASTVGWLAEVPDTTTLPPTGLDMLQAYRVAPASLQEVLVGDGGNATQVLFQVGPSSLEQRAVVLDRVEAAIAEPGDAAVLPAMSSATTGGLAVVGVGLLENITANRAELTIVALVLVAAFLMVLYRDIVRGLLTMVPVLLAVGTSAVLVRTLGITLSPLTTVGGPLVVATCAEFSVLLVARYAEERARGLDPERSTKVAAERTGPRVLHVGAHHARRVRRAHVLEPAAAQRLRHGRDHQHRCRTAVGARRRAAAGARRPTAVACSRWGSGLRRLGCRARRAVCSPAWHSLPWAW